LEYNLLFINQLGACYDCEADDLIRIGNTYIVTNLVWSVNVTYSS